MGCWMRGNVSYSTTVQKPSGYELRGDLLSLENKLPHSCKIKHQKIVNNLNLYYILFSCGIWLKLGSTLLNPFVRVACSYEEKLRFFNVI